MVKNGFTLVELIVTMGIVGFIVMLFIVPPTEEVTAIPCVEKTPPRETPYNLNEQIAISRKEHSMCIEKVLYWKLGDYVTPALRNYHGDISFIPCINSAPDGPADHILIN